MNATRWRGGRGARSVLAALTLGIVAAGAAAESIGELERLTLAVEPKVLNPVQQPGATARLVVTGYDAAGRSRRLRADEVLLSARTREASGNVTVASIEGLKVIPREGGIATVEAAVDRGGRRLSASTDVVVRPFYRDYHQTLVLKLFLGMEGRPVERLAQEPMFQKPHDVLCTFAQALEVIRRADRLTRGMPKIVYLVGWQKGGHDTGTRRGTR